MQCVAVCCSVLQWCSVVQCGVSRMRRIELSTSQVQVNTRCSVGQCGVSAVQRGAVWYYAATHCNMHYAATHCSMLQHTAICSMLQHTATCASCVWVRGYALTVHGRLRCSVLQCVPAYCSVLQCLCSVLQSVAVC